jgi:MtN3 and saliva related transmembrane protein
MISNEILGLVAGIITTGSFVPQAYKVFRKKETADLSSGMYTLFICGLILWTIYGIRMQAISIILANSVSIFLSLYILIMKLKHG